MPPCSQSEPSSRRNSVRNGRRISTDPFSARSSVSPRKRWYGELSNRISSTILRLHPCSRHRLQCVAIELARRSEWQGVEKKYPAGVSVWGATLEEELLQFLLGRPSFLAKSHERDRHGSFAVCGS